MQVSRRTYLRIIATSTSASLVGCNQLPLGNDTPPYQRAIPEPGGDVYTRDTQRYYRPKRIHSVSNSVEAPALGDYDSVLDRPIGIPSFPFDSTRVGSYTFGDVDWYLTDGTPLVRLYSNEDVVAATRETLGGTKWERENAYRGFDRWRLNYDVFAIDDEIVVYVAGNTLQRSGRPTLEAVVDAIRGDSRYATVNRRYRELCAVLGDGLVVHVPGMLNEPVDSPEREFVDGVIGGGISLHVDGDDATVVRAIAYDSPDDVSVDAVETHVDSPGSDRTAEMYGSYESLTVSRDGGIVSIEGTMPASELTAEAMAYRF